MHLNMWWPNPSHVCDDTKCILTCVDKNPSNSSEDTNCILTCADETHPILIRKQIVPQLRLLNPSLAARPQNVSQHVLTKPLPCPHGHYTHLTKSWPNSSDASEHTNCMYTLLTKPISCQWAHKMHLNKCWKNPSHANQDTNWISTFTDRRGHRMHF